MPGELHWQARNLDTGALLTKPIVAILRFIHDGEDAVQEACEDYFRGREHRHLEALNVIVTAPAEVAGVYRVDLRRVLKASVQKQD